MRKELIVISIVLFFTACTKKLSLNVEKGKYLLYNQGYKGNKYFSRDVLSAYEQQKPNKKVLGIRFGLYFYYLGKKFHDTAFVTKKIYKTTAKYDTILAHCDTSKTKKILSKKTRKIKKLNTALSEGNFVMRKLGSVPVIYDSSLSEATKRQITGFLRNKGCFNAKISYKADTVLGGIFVNYQINEGVRYKISAVNYEPEDGNLKRLINEHWEDHLIDTNTFYDEQKLIEERDRLEKLFRSNGYFDFSKKYINYLLDTAESKVSINVMISNTEKGDFHKLYKLKSVQFIVDGEEEKPLNDSSSTLENYKGVDFYFHSRTYSPKILAGKMQIGPANKYNYQYSQYTQRNLSQLDVFRTLNINYEKDTSQQLLTAIINASSSTKYQISDEIGFSVSQGLPGPFGSITFLARNVFNGCELFDINIRGGIEGVASATDAQRFYQSQELSVSTGLTFPRMFFLQGLNRLFINNNPRTKFQLGYNFVSRPEYRRTNTRAAITYFLSKGQYNQYSLGLLDINYLQTPFLQNQFREYLDVLFATTGNNLRRSFLPSVASNINFGYTYNTFQLGQNKNATFFRFYSESGGSTLNFIPRDQQDAFKNALRVSSIYIYWKFNIDIRKYLPVTKKSTFATRFNLGIANPYSGDGALPYERYFFSGGSNSIRAWLPRRLGPGRFANYNSDGTINFNFEQPGLVQLELNEEYRFKIFKYFDGALFIDAGNVWLLNDADVRKNINPNFVSDIAIGTGYGFRLDFSFIIVRLDAGYKTYNPAAQGDRWVIKNIDFLNASDWFTKAVWNIGVGYPF
mgnify:CR=1 FL=1